MPLHSVNPNANAEKARLAISKPILSPPPITPGEQVIGCHVRKEIRIDFANFRPCELGVARKLVVEGPLRNAEPLRNHGLFNSSPGDLSH